MIYINYIDNPLDKYAPNKVIKKTKFVCLSCIFIPRIEDSTHVYTSF